MILLGLCASPIRPIATAPLWFKPLAAPLQFLDYPWNVPRPAQFAIPLQKHRNPPTFPFPQ
ncbi:MAG: hypothetical protein ACFB8W_08895 [Elainellaceae cyanobacterium]